MQRRLLTLVACAATALIVAPTAAAQAEPPPRQGCDAALVSAGPVEVTLLGTVTVQTPGTSLRVTLSGLAGSLVCGIIGGGGGPVPAPPVAP